MSKKKEPEGKAVARKNKRPAPEKTEIRILLVDDHPIVRKGLAELLAGESDLQIVAEAEDYQQALAALRNTPADLAIIDLTLKDIGGLELIKQIRSLYPDLKILVLSMHDEALYAERALRAGAGGYIMKQEGSDRLITAVRTVMRGEIFVSERMASRMLGKMVIGGKSARQGTSPLERLSDRELEVFELIGRGFGTRQVADRLCISIKTIESHREHIKEKLNLKNATELVQHATQWVNQEQVK